MYFLQQDHGYHLSSLIINTYVIIWLNISFISCLIWQACLLHVKYLHMDGVINTCISGSSHKFNHHIGIYTYRSFCGNLPHERQSTGVSIQETASWFHVHGNVTIRYLVLCEIFFLLEKPNLFAFCNNTFSKWWEGWRMACRRVLSSTPLLVRGSETAGNRNLQTTTYKQKIQLIQVARIWQTGRGASIDTGAFGLAARWVSVHWCEHCNGIFTFGS
jgi:hypothetical protein